MQVQRLETVLMENKEVVSLYINIPNWSPR